ncbi:MAG: hypothetical protein QOJ65_1303 [Fimbriimonadaceae bacterium]|jgi:hypothetical protein|nr:hypothetical protein [Fimbriimonadaceae bacterium]
MSFLLSFLAAVAIGAQTPLGKPIDQKPIARYKNLAAYPIYESLGHVVDSQYITLDEGLKAGTVTVSERGSTPIIRIRTPSPPTPAGGEYQSSAEVNTLWLTNKSGKKLLLISGEMVRGGQQDRIIGKDTIIPPGKEPVDLGVYCVEHGRWSGSAGFGSAPSSVSVASPAIRNSAQNEQSQTQVWGKVRELRVSNGISGGSDAYRALAADKIVVGKVEDYVHAIDAKFPDQKATGVAIAVNGKLLWVDRFGSNALFRKYWPRLLRSYAMEALTSQTRMPTPPPSADEAERFVKARDGKISYEVSEHNSKLVKIEDKQHVILQLQDLSTKPISILHESKTVK